MKHLPTLPKPQGYTLAQVQAYAAKAVAQALRPISRVKPHGLKMADYLRQKRKESKMTLAVAASHLSISRHLLGNMENGHRGPTSLTLLVAAEMARVYRVPIEELVEAVENTTYNAP